MHNCSIRSSQEELQRVYDGVKSAGKSADAIRNEDHELLAVKLNDAVDTTKISPKISPYRLDLAYSDESIWNLEASLPFTRDGGLHSPDTLELLDLIVGIEKPGKLATKLGGLHWAQIITDASDLHIDLIREAHEPIGGLNVHITTIGEVAVRFGLLRNHEDYKTYMGAKNQSLEQSCLPFSEPCLIKPNDVVIFRGNGHRSGLHPVAHDFVTQSQPRKSDVFIANSGEPSEVLANRNIAIERFELGRFGYQTAA